MSKDDLKDLLIKLSMGRRDAAEQLAELLAPLLVKEPEVKAKKAAK